MKGYSQRKVSVRGRLEVGQSISYGQRLWVARFYHDLCRGGRKTGVPSKEEEPAAQSGWTAYRQTVADPRTPGFLRVPFLMRSTMPRPRRTFIKSHALRSPINSRAAKSP